MAVIQILSGAPPFSCDTLSSVPMPVTAEENLERTGAPPSSHVLSVGSLVPKVRPRCGSWEGGRLGRIHNLDQEEAAPREIVEDQDDEGPVEVNAERLGRHILGDPGGGSFLRPLLIELQRGLVDHLLEWTRPGLSAWGSGPIHEWAPCC